MYDPNLSKLNGPSFSYVSKMLEVSRVGHLLNHESSHLAISSLQQTSTMASKTGLRRPTSRLLFTAALLSTQSLLASCFRPSLATPRLSALHGEAAPLPFFAAPASFASAPASSAPQSSTVTLRLPLGTLFDGRDYIFVTYTNVRG